MPFLRLTRDRRGFENTFLMHADRPGDRPRLLYWYRTAPGIVLGRPALDEDAIRTIEEQHPDIEFDWPAILALSEVMTPEEEAPVKPRQNAGRKGGGARKEREPRSGDRSARPVPAAESPSTSIDDVDQSTIASNDDVDQSTITSNENVDQSTITSNENVDESTETFEENVDSVGERRGGGGTGRHHVGGVLEELVGREIATRLRARHSEILARIHERTVDAAAKDQWLKRAEEIDPDLWLTPDRILEGVRNADALFAQLHAELHSSRE